MIISLPTPLFSVDKEGKMDNVGDKKTGCILDRKGLSTLISPDLPDMPGCSNAIAVGGLPKRRSYSGEDGFRGVVRLC